MHLKTVCILKLFNSVLNVCLSISSLFSEFPYFIEFFWLFCHILRRLCSSFLPELWIDQFFYSITHFCFTYLEAVSFCAYAFRIIIFSWWMNFSSLWNYHCLSLIKILTLKSESSDINLLWQLSLTIYMICFNSFVFSTLYLRWVYCKQHIGEFLPWVWLAIVMGWILVLKEIHASLNTTKNLSDFHSYRNPFETRGPFDIASYVIWMAGKEHITKLDFQWIWVCISGSSLLAS